MFNIINGVNWRIYPEKILVFRSSLRVFIIHLHNLLYLPNYLNHLANVLFSKLVRYV
jgi:hypothetical protein